MCQQFCAESQSCESKGSCAALSCASRCPSVALRENQESPQLTVALRTLTGLLVDGPFCRPPHITRRRPRLRLWPFCCWLRAVRAAFGVQKKRQKTTLRFADFTHRRSQNKTRFSATAPAACTVTQTNALWAAQIRRIAAVLAFASASRHLGVARGRRREFQAQRLIMADLIIASVVSTVVQRVTSCGANVYIPQRQQKRQQVSAEVGLGGPGQTQRVAGHGGTSVGP